MIKALWGMDYDFHTDRCYQRPLCPECNAPIYSKGDRFYCISCGSEMEVTKDMADWIKKREKTKVETKDCQKIKLGDCVFGCGGKKTVEAHYVKNPITLKWQYAWSHCSQCGRHIIA